MNRKEIINRLKKYNLDVNRYLIISGTAMVLRGIKEETQDIDISVTEDLEEELLEDYLSVLEHTNTDGTHAYMINDEINFGVKYYSEQRDFIDGLPVQKVEDIIKIKTMLNRPKDKYDLKLLKKI